MFIDIFMWNKKFDILFIQMWISAHVFFTSVNLLLLNIYF